MIDQLPFFQRAQTNIEPLFHSTLFTINSAFLLVAFEDGGNFHRLVPISTVQSTGREKTKKLKKMTEQSTGPGGGPGDMVLFIEKHNFFPCSFAFFVVRKWKKQEHLEEHLQSIYDGLLGREEVHGYWFSIFLV